MLNLPPPPLPPSHNGLALGELAEYYRQLVSYHQRGLLVATQQLYYVESILNSNRTLNTDAASEQISLLLPNSNSLGADNSDAYSEGVLESSSDIQSLNKGSDSDGSDEQNIYQRLAQVLEANKGKMLHVDYLSWELHGRLDDKKSSVLKAEVKRALALGEEEGHWFAVPDSPDCWTIDLNDFPDFSSKKSQNRQKTRKHKSINDKVSQRLPYSEKLEMFVTLTTAIQECLQLHYPKTMNATDIMQWLYPNRLSASQKETVRSSINSTLSKGCNTQGWKRVKTGYYISDI